MQLKLEDFNVVLERLKVVNYGANLAGGTIHWTDASGAVVAHAQIKAVLSWAATNNSAMWASGIGQFEDAGVPVVVFEEAKGDYIGNINDIQAAELAGKAAAQAGAAYLYRASNGANGLYLAIFDFKEESIELTPEDIARKKRSVMGYSMQMLNNLGEILNNKKRVAEAKNLMNHYHKALAQQLEHVAGEDTALQDAIQKQQKSIQIWKDMLPKKRKDVLAFMKQAASKWGRMMQDY